MQAASYMCVCVQECAYMFVCVNVYAASTDQRTHRPAHTWRHTQSPHRNPHTSRSSQKTLSYSYSLSHSLSLSFPPTLSLSSYHCLIPAHTSVPLKTVQNSALLASGFSFLSFLFVVFFCKQRILLVATTWTWATPTEATAPLRWLLAKVTAI